MGENLALPLPRLYYREETVGPIYFGTGKKRELSETLSFAFAGSTPTFLSPSGYVISSICSPFLT